MTNIELVPQRSILNIIINNTFKIACLFILLLSLSCSNEEACAYLPNTEPDPSINCNLQSELNLSTGIDVGGNVIPPGKGIIDPFWRVINNPPLLNCTSPLVSTINGSAYLINFANFGADAWVNQTGTTTLAPIDLGTSDSFGCNNALNNESVRVPYVFERPFCIIEDTCIDFNFSLKGDDQVYLQLIDNATNAVLSTSPTYIWTSTEAQNWTESNLCLSAGSYSIRAFLVNTNAIVLGFSMLGNLTTGNGDASISNNIEGCCVNNVISVLNILEENCDGKFDSGSDQLGSGWTFNLKDASGTIIRTETTDANGDAFFSGLADGTYTIEIVNQTGWLPSNPTTGTATVTVSNNQVELLQFFNCRA